MQQSFLVSQDVVCYTLFKGNGKLEAKFFDNNNGFVLVAEYRNGELLPIGSHRLQWLRELLEHEDKVRGEL